MDWSRVRWCLQSNLGSPADLEALTRALDAIGVRYELLRVVPFDEVLPPVSNEGLTIFYGATTLIQNVARLGRFRPGVFFDEPRFSFEALLEHYGEHLLNADSEVMTVSSLLSRDFAPSEELFVRPAADGKEFTGAVMSGAELAVWRERIGGSNGPLSLDTRVQLASPKPIACEWRVFMVDGRAVASSRYRTRMRLNVSAEVPSTVLEFAARMAEIYAPAEVFTLDVGETDDGLRVIETNCFNSSGFYACDISRLVRAVTVHTLRRADLMA